MPAGALPGHQLPPQPFREQVPGVLDRYQRRTARLSMQVSAFTRERGGVLARLPPDAGIAASRHTMLRVLLRTRYPRAMS